jgi:carboxylate-amine ligase
MGERTVGIEEELLVVDPRTGRPVPLAADVLRADPRDEDAGLDARPVEGELMRQQVEVQTKPCATLAELRGEIAGERAVVAELAAGQGLAVAPLATSPFDVEHALADKTRYRRLADRFGPIVDAQLVCGCHLHVVIASRAEGVGIIDRIRPWLAPLLAISANSPYWRGEDTGYASYRSPVWSRWPSAGPTEEFGSPAAYDAAVQALIDSGGALDGAAAYFDARLAAEHPTVEIRVADVCLDVDSAVLLGALARGLIDWAAAGWAQDQPVPPVRTELLRAASWRAARYGLTGELLDPRTLRPAPAADVLWQLVELVRPALAGYADETEVEKLVEQVLANGTGGERQRSAVAASGRLEDAVRLAVAQMTP